VRRPSYRIVADFDKNKEIQAARSIEITSMSSTQSESEFWSGIPEEKRPRHIAMIMDGNGRWAQERSQPRIKGHQQGAETVRQITEECARLGIEQLTLYCLSSENWKRPELELEFLMHLLTEYLVNERETLNKNNIRLEIIGRRERIPEEVQREMDRSIELTSKNTGTLLCLAINYGGRAEIVDAIRSITRRVKEDGLEVDAIDEQMVSDHLYTAGMSDPDLMVRTAGEMRISNYLLWQLSYAELWVTQKYWPEFSTEDLRTAIEDYSKRKRRFGGLNRTTEEKPDQQESSC
jgi:undecaprenyl diphosphate synthase